ncbi:phage Gp37/Gp68 family protein [Eubacteriales bacterium OttesenSCG-928-K08]|nr:phage Gp37/Gp68 family protein [Eubacteriales bacterium OttesenSCG-928-K08]
MNWEPWTGCYPASDGCKYCYFYGPYAKRYGQNTIQKTDKFDWPIRKNAKGEYNIKGGKILATCFATDFFLPEADAWREEVWAMIKQRQDIDFLILTKRIDRFPVALPADWGDGYDNVNIGCTVENQALTDARLPLFLSYPIKRRFVACSPLLEAIDLSSYIGGIDHVTVSGESGREARVCNYDWVLDIKEQCRAAGITFWFKSTGSLFERDGVAQKINPYKQGSLAKELDISISDGKRLF